MAGLEPAWPIQPSDFKSDVYTSSTTLACVHKAPYPALGESFRAANNSIDTSCEKASKIVTSASIPRRKMSKLRCGFSEFSLHYFKATVPVSSMF